MATNLEQFRRFFEKRMQAGRESHFGALGLSNPSIEHGRASLEMPYNEELVGNPETGVMSGGAMTALLDSCCALAAATVMEQIAFSPTLDLRVDHMGLAEPGKALIAEAEVYRATRAVIFTRGIIYQEDPDQPVARALVNFTPIEHPVVDFKSPTGAAHKGES